MMDRLLLCLVTLSQVAGLLCASINGSVSSALSFSYCPNDILVISDVYDETSRVPVVWNEPSLTGGEGDVQVTNNIPLGNKFSWGCTEVTYTASDTTGHTDCSFRICVSNTTDQFYESYDVTVHYKSCPEGNIHVDNENSDIAVELLPDSGLDDDEDTGEDKPSDAKFTFGCTRVTYTGQDATGRTATCSFLVCAGKAWATPAIIAAVIFVAVAVVSIACIVMMKKCC